MTLMTDVKNITLNPLNSLQRETKTMKTENKFVLAEKIAGILNTAPSDFDVEDDVTDSTNAQIVSEEVNLDWEEEKILSKFRRANVDLLCELDEKYAGKKTSRRDFKDSESEETSSQEVEAESDRSNESDEINSDELKDEETPEESDQYEEPSHDSSSEDSGSEDLDMTTDITDENDPSFKTMRETNVSSQIKKGNSVRNQMLMWENLLEMRIQLQKCLVTANKLPQNSTFAEIKKESGLEFSNKVSETKSKLCGALDKLLFLQKMLLRKHPDTKNLEKTSLKSEDGDGEEEEIPSDTDNEQSSEEDKSDDAPKKKRMKLEEYEEHLSNQHTLYAAYRNNVIQNWNDKTRIVLKGGATSHSILSQIEYTLSNKEKLRKRTQLKRSEYPIVGEEMKNDRNDEEYQVEIFDDDDFYHQLLRELIEVKSADVTDPVQLGRQWIQLQNLRSKMKRKIDTRATKGRKIRYAVHTKLVNFMAPIDSNLWTEEAKSELYNSLFGKS